jgi:hypothetical protein
MARGLYGDARGGAKDGRAPQARSRQEKPVDSRFDRR